MNLIRQIELGNSLAIDPDRSRDIREIRLEQINGVWYWNLYGPAGAAQN